MQESWRPPFELKRVAGP